MLYGGPLFPPAYTPELVPKARRKRSPDRESILLSKEWLYLRCHVSRKVGELKAKLLGLQQPQQRACLRIGSSRLDKLDGAVRETRQVSKFLTREPSRNSPVLETFAEDIHHMVLRFVSRSVWSCTEDHGAAPKMSRSRFRCERRSGSTSAESTDNTRKNV